MLLSVLAYLTLLVSAGGTRNNAPRGVNFPRQSQTDGLQNVVTWDQYSLLLNGKRLGIFSGEVHPYRMPVQSLHLDVFQKVKSMGFNAVSFYVFWGILEPKQGTVSFQGFRDLQPFFDAAMKAGLYLIARPGPYINAETSGGGFPGWGTRTPGLWRTDNATYVEAYQAYIKAVGNVIAKNQITNGGPVILVQAENEYSGWQEGFSEDFAYENRLMADLRAAGITVPITTNDAWPGGHFTSVDIYGYDSYPNGFDCFNSDVWASDAVPEQLCFMSNFSNRWLWASHMSINPQTLNAVYEFQAGAFDPWGGAGYEACAARLGPEFERVFYKAQFAMSTTVFNLYMIFGGTNWGGISHPGGYSSYDYGASLTEDRTLREKYYELKLQANFRAVSPAFLTTRPMNNGAAQGSFTGNMALTTTQVLDVVGNQTGFYVVRQTDASSFAVQTYKLTVPTSIGNITIPSIGNAELTLNGRDSKIHVVDYQAGKTTLLYSTGEIMTWATIDNRDIIVLYGSSGELHETAIKFTGAAPKASVVSGHGVLKQTTLSGNSLVLQYTTSGQTVVQVGPSIVLYIVDRETAYDFWVLHPPVSGAFAQFSTDSPILVKGGYLLRSATTSGSSLALTGDLNATSSFEIIAPAAVSKSVTFNGAPLQISKTSYGTLLAEKKVTLPAVSLPDLARLTWKTTDSLPEIQPTYSDALWPLADHSTTVSPVAHSTPVVLYASDYGFHTGNILWRAHFNATGTETAFTVNMWGGSAFGYSVWLDSTFIGSFAGDPAHADFEGTFAFAQVLTKGSNHILTIVQDHMGLEENWTSAQDFFKNPRGILSYSFVGSNSTTVSTWKVTGNLGGEDYIDTTRGPLNEGGLFGERQGWHLPGFNDASWAVGKPTDGISHAGISFYRTTFDLNIPKGVDYPLALVLTNSTVISQFRSQLYVNGYQFGKYVNHIGPQTSFPVPQGILNYNGPNTLAVSLWAAESSGAKLDSLKLQLTAKIESNMPVVVNQPLTPWSRRPGAY
ncbi:glycoside hydrolase family 35 protein [Mycena floridula]|nr:glycoside hydrolase family 35 protein [Mycena floridula]